MIAVPQEEHFLDFDAKIEGLIVIKNFVSDEEEQCLLNFMSHEFQNASMIIF